MMPAKMDTSGLFKTKVFWNKGHDVISLVDGAKNKRYQWFKLYLDVFLWAEFGNSSISMREAIAT